MRRQATGQAGFFPARLARAIRDTISELLDRLLPLRRRRANPRVIKRKKANWALQRAGHFNPPEPAITIIAATKPVPAKRQAKT